MKLTFRFGFILALAAIALPVTAQANDACQQMAAFFKRALR